MKSLVLCNDGDIISVQGEALRIKRIVKYEGMPHIETHCEQLNRKDDHVTDDWIAEPYPRQYPLDMYVRKIA